MPGWASWRICRIADSRGFIHAFSDFMECMVRRPALHGGGLDFVGSALREEDGFARFLVAGLFSIVGCRDPSFLGAVDG